MLRVLDYCIVGYLEGRGWASGLLNNFNMLNVYYCNKGLRLSYLIIRIIVILVDDSLASLGES